ncbi:hypothetical protein HED42_16880 [Enterococcus casseliflavus]|uniref:hypothetical protein n=1 Tax=Enterococcus casseliflavus TaxID=37734 RepID=UPI0014334687|nr:hypothetical protein [Enterococcus casseliflavus]NKD39809.1 hypothetical protein [Enterococcus casseliflavus]
MGKRYIYSLFIGLVLFFQLQVLSYYNYLLIMQAAMNGVRDPYYILQQTPLLIIPSLFLGYFGYGAYKAIIKKRKN